MCLYVHAFVCLRVRMCSYVCARVCACEVMYHVTREGERPPGPEGGGTFVLEAPPGHVPCPRGRPRPRLLSRAARHGPPALGSPPAPPATAARAPTFRVWPPRARRGLRGAGDPRSLRFCGAASSEVEEDLITALRAERSAPRVRRPSEMETASGQNPGVPRGNQGLRRA